MPDSQPGLILPAWKPIGCGVAGVRTRRGRAPQSDTAREPAATRIARLAEVLRWTGFSPLRPAEADAGPFVKHPEEHSFLRLDAEAYNAAIISELRGGSGNRALSRASGMGFLGL